MTIFKAMINVVTALRSTRKEQGELLAKLLVNYLKAKHAPSIGKKARVKSLFEKVINSSLVVENLKRQPITCLFIWEGTEEGHDFYSKLNKEYIDILSRQSPINEGESL